MRWSQSLPPLGDVPAVPLVLQHPPKGSQSWLGASDGAEPPRCPQGWGSGWDPLDCPTCHVPTPQGSLLPAPHPAASPGPPAVPLPSWAVTPLRPARTASHSRRLPMVLGVVVGAGTQGFIGCPGWEGSGVPQSQQPGTARRGQFHAVMGPRGPASPPARGSPGAVPWARAPVQLQATATPGKTSQI